jgi:hypothetical protein
MGSSLTRMVLTNTAPSTNAWAPRLSQGLARGVAWVTSSWVAFGGTKMAPQWELGRLRLGFRARVATWRRQKMSKIRGKVVQAPFQRVYPARTNSLRTGSHGHFSRWFSYRHLLYRGCSIVFWFPEGTLVGGSVMFLEDPCRRCLNLWLGNSTSGLLYVGFKIICTNIGAHQMVILNFTSSWDFVIFREYWISRSRCNIW